MVGVRGDRNGKGLRGVGGSRGWWGSGVVGHRGGRGSRGGGGRRWWGSGVGYRGFGDLGVVGV